jgi:hypothetical protein
VADPLSGALDTPVRIRQLGAVGQMQVDVRPVRDDREHEVPHRAAPPDREQAVGRVERLDRVGELGQDGVMQRPSDSGDAGRGRVEMPVEGDRVLGAIHGPGRLSGRRD